MQNIRTLTPFLLTALLLTGCSGDAIETGGGAGDTSFDADPAAVALITPLVGLYDLPDNWEGGSSEAFLEIQSPDTSGSAMALLFRFNAFANCYDPNPTLGDVTRDLFFDRIFLDNILSLDSSVLSLSGTSLVITLEDINDINGDGNFDETVSLQAPRISMLASDLMTCS